MTEQAANKCVRVEREGRVVILTIDRPEALNALNLQVLSELTDAMVPLDSDPGVGCFVLTGSAKAFAAGADIAEMRDRTYPDAFLTNMLAGWEAIAQLRTPKIAAVSGYALGGGCELAMMCDTIYCGQSARFGQPEIKLGVIPGMGGSQRLTRLVGKSKAMDMILTGRMMDADEAKEAGLVARIYPDDELLGAAKEAAAQIASYSKTTALVAREAVDRALETSLSEGLLFERRIFQSLFGTDDQKEGMSAFIEKRKADFKR
ncbi:enoyl-CoA hydratase-related protein [Granulosicoccus antarcticus]|uniref:enoyl-CoA hydratase n=1 Tax=Granulosicoccus antarcticus IMCC3135 TaxID=1192854 RepID=A0A2Z2NSA8_9GAMM|nr:enoyl-CoA hydratase-related protein [Granulosicoccus antarcticus]ASJ72891.1 putative enoyl-CoA hydratase echA8 [Granulosicoccus antarcticus IMCC3135]